jgi:DNA-directed RNA polymerase subunit M/transcription elongation factor TFIIS
MAATYYPEYGSREWRREQRHRRFLHMLAKGLSARGKIELFSDCPKCGDYGLHFMGAAQKGGTGPYVVRQCQACEFSWNETL